MRGFAKPTIASADRTSAGIRAIDPNHNPRPAEQLSVVIGGAAILAGLLANERLLGFLFAPDALITGGARNWIRLAEAILIGGGATLAMLRPSIETAALWPIRRWPGFVAALLGIFGVLGLGILIELGFHAYNTIGARHRPPEIVRYSAPLWQTDVVCDSQKTIGDREIYDVTYRRDAMGARVTPDSTRAITGQDLVFFGGSFTFGQGVEDDETLPNRVAQLAPDWRVTNYGYPGHGPAQMLDRLQQPGGLRGFTGNKIIVIDVFIPDHVRRTIGSMRIATTWGRQFPLFLLDPDGRLDRRGTMESGRPVLSRVYEYLAREPVMKCFNVDLPLSVIDQDLELVARIDAETKALIGRANPLAEFVVVLFPDRPGVEFPAVRLIPHLEAVGVRYLDYSARLQDEEGLWIPGDGHPTSKAYARVAQWIAHDLQLPDPEAVSAQGIRTID